MAGYIVLGKWTQQGMATIKTWSERIKGVYAAAEKAGINVVGTWVTMGEYDTIAIFDAPDEQTMTTFVLNVVKSGNVTTQTLRALSEEEFAQVVSKLP